jgi:chemotaxis-related protein WspB
MLLVVCHCGASRYAVEARHVAEVLPRADLARLPGAAAWLAGMLVCRGKATPVVDLVELAAGTPCPNRLSSRIVVLETELRGVERRFGLLAERVGLREMYEDADTADAGPSDWGALRLDDEGLFQLVDPARLITAQRQAVLFPAMEAAG